MNFLSPLSLILFLPLGGIIVLLYLLKLKRKERTVSSIMLWQDAVADIQANAPFQRLKKSLLLLLQLLALLLLVVAIARPYVRAPGLAENRIVVILDSSASMQSTDVSPSRFEAAKGRALKLVRDMGPGDTMLVMTAGAKTRVVASFTSDKKALASAISGLKPADTQCNMRTALLLALSLVKGKSVAPPRILILSDGGVEPLSDLSAGNANLDFIRLGKRCDNVAITGLDSRKMLSGDAQVFVGLRNFSNRTRAFDLEIYLDDQLIDIREKSLAPGASDQEILKDVADVGGRVTAKLDIADDLAADNSGSVYLAKRREINALLVSKGNVFLQNALNLDPRTRLTRVESVPADLAKKNYDLVVFDEITPPKSLPPGGYLLINTASAQGPGVPGEKVERPTVIDSDRRHPASAYVDFSSVRIAEARYLVPREWATSIVEGEGGALGVAGVKSGRRFVQISFSLLESDFPLRVGFPIFAANCLDYLVPEKNRAAGENIRAGEPVYIDAPPEVEMITVTSPDGSQREIRITQSPVTFESTERVGVYKVRGEKFEKEFACNLSSAAESNCVPRDVLTVGAKKFASAGRQVRTNKEYYGWLILLALAVLTFEWYAFHRRL
ncbi:MAG: hypothetical protein A2Z18_04525 [Armatimonadetes bacterium RBG_16_58_9]|nr:MAG: hypothetical protein A2Z18_04525 [Armatimonadetes bacterium RBG_16_58_9]